MPGIRRVAVLGAGTMGAAIAAHAANAGLEVDLLDLPATSGDRDQIVRGGFERMTAARPGALMHSSAAERIRLGNFDDDFGRVAQADWVIEAVVERLEPKRQLMERVEATAQPGAVLSSNTSGIPLAAIARGRSEDFRRRFLGTHFFNPPRYLKLVELIVTPDTDPAVVARARTLIERELGKGVVFAKDTPNFIANRLGVMAGMATAGYAIDHGYTVEEVDALTGPLIGWPKTATFRLFDQVGLDVMLGVAENLHELAPDDDQRKSLVAPAPLQRMRDANLLGIKTGGGFYRRAKRDGRAVFDVLDLASVEQGTPSYRPATEPDLPIVETAGDVDDLGARLRLIMEKAGTQPSGGDRGARFLRDLLLPALAYASRRVPEIAESLVDVDHAMEWGFGHRHGPFRIWDLLGVHAAVEQMDELGIPVGGWVRELLAKGHERFYVQQDGTELVYTPRTGNYEPVPVDPEEIDLGRVRAADGEVAGNTSASLVDLGDGVLCLELHAPASAIDEGVVKIGAAALRELQHDRWHALVVASRKRNFCVGANLGGIGMLAYQIAAGDGDTTPISHAVKGLQDVLMGFRFAPKPVVAAPHGQTLGGGAEICLAADRVVAAAETYMGLVEVGAGVIPAGGGCKELLRRLVSPAVAGAQDVPPLPHVQRVFETIALAKVSTSAFEARTMGFLTGDDRVVMHPDRQLAAAKREALALSDGYRPPARDAMVYAAGAPVLAALELGVRTLQWAGHATEYDGVVGGHLARVLCGGELSAPQWVREDHILELERTAFTDLIVRQPTLERIQALLTTGKPLRN